MLGTEPHAVIQSWGLGDLGQRVLLYLKEGKKAK